jgi:hypothetical protein
MPAWEVEGVTQKGTDQQSLGLTPFVSPSSVQVVSGGPGKARFTEALAHFLSVKSVSSVVYSLHYSWRFQCVLPTCTPKLSAVRVGSWMLGVQSLPKSGMSRAIKRLAGWRAGIPMGANAGLTNGNSPEWCPRPG